MSKLIEVKSVVKMKLTLWYRVGTVDENCIEEYFEKNNYAKNIYEVKRNGVVFDIGGHIGLYALRIEKERPDLTIYSFEPQHENYKLLCRNLSDNKSKVIPVNLAISNVDGKIFLRCGDSTGSWSKYVHLSSCIHFTPDGGYDVEALTIESVMKKLNIPSIDFIKIDVEGQEIDIFPSIPDWVYEQISNIDFEMHDVLSIHTLNNLVNLLFSKGYGVYPWKSIGSKLDLRKGMGKWISSVGVHPELGIPSLLFSQVEFVPLPAKDHSIKNGKPNYEEAYFTTEAYIYGGYRDFPVHQLTVQKILECKPKSVIELGGARGYICKRLSEHGILATCLDISNYCYRTRAHDDFILIDLTKAVIPKKDKEYDLAFSIAFLEHIPEEKLEFVVRESMRVSNRGLHGITFTITPEDIDQTHRLGTIKPKEWWIEKFKSIDSNYPVEILDKEDLEHEIASDTSKISQTDTVLVAINNEPIYKYLRDEIKEGSQP